MARSWTVRIGLGAALLQTHLLGGDPTSLTDAVTTLRAALAATDPACIEHDIARAALAGVLISVYEIDGDPATLADAITLAGQAAEATTPDDPDRYAALLNHAIALKHRYERIGDPADLAAAQEQGERALAAAGHGTAAQVACQANLATFHQAAFEITGDPAALEEGADPASEGPVTAVLRVNLGEVVRLSSASGPSAAELRAEAATHLDLVIDAPAATTSVRVRAAITRAALATIDERWDEAVTRYHAAIDLLPRLAYRAMPLADRLRQLHDTSGLACDAAAAALNAERPELAVQLLEAGRSVLLTQELDLRGDLTELHHALPEQAAELERLRAELDLPTDAGTATGERPAARLTAGTGHRAAGKNWWTPSARTPTSPTSTTSPTTRRWPTRPPTPRWSSSTSAGCAATYW